MSLPVSRDALPMAGGQPIDEAIADQTADWLTLLMSGEATDEDRRRWQQWRAAHPDHERAWRHVETVTRKLRVLEPGAGYRTLSPYAGRLSQGRRRAIHFLLWGGMIGTSGLMVKRTETWQRSVADHHTGTGEQRTLTLDDGTRVTLNTGSAIDVHFDDQFRRVRLVSGEVLVVTAYALHGEQDRRPFLVQTAEGRIRALGTRFVARQHEGRTGVAVLESAVEITPANGLGVPRVLQAGERASFSSIEVGAAAAMDEQTAVAWTRGQIVVTDMPLGEFLMELARYRPGVLRCDPQVAGLRISGVFPLQDTDRILSTLPNVLPVQVRLWARYWVLVEAVS